MGAASGGCGICGCTTGAVGWTMGASKAGAGSSGCTASLVKKSAAAVTTGSATMGGGVGLDAGRSGSCPKVPPGPTISGSMGSLPPSERAVWSGPRSTSKAARGWATLTRTGVMGGAAGSGWARAAGAASVSAASAPSPALPCVPSAARRTSSPAPLDAARQARPPRPAARPRFRRIPHRSPALPAGWRCARRGGQRAALQRQRRGRGYRR